MPRLRPRARVDVRPMWPVETGSRVTLAALSLTGGIAILLGRAERFSGDAYYGMRQIAPWWAWGIGGIIIGVAQLLLRNRARRAALVLAGVAWFTIAYGWWDSSTHSARVGFLGIAVFVCIGVMHAIASTRHPDEH